MLDSIRGSLPPLQLHTPADALSCHYEKENPPPLSCICWHFLKVTWRVINTSLVLYLQSWAAKTQQGLASVKKCAVNLALKV